MSRLLARHYKEPAVEVKEEQPRKKEPTVKRKPVKRTPKKAGE